MNLNFEVTNSKELQTAYREFGLAVGDKFLSAALKRAGKIGVKAVKAIAPRGGKISLYRPKKGTLDPLSYRRGGATEGDIRAKVVVDGTQTKLLIGVSKSQGKVGWRTHFLEYGTAKMAAQPFVNAGVEHVVPLIEADIENSLDVVIARYRNRL